MTKQQYLDSLPKVNGKPNIPGVACDRKQNEYHVCQMTEEGWYCNKCKQTYPYRIT